MEEDPCTGQAGHEDQEAEMKDTSVECISISSTNAAHQLQSQERGLYQEEFVEDEGYFAHYSVLEVFSPEAVFEILRHLDWQDVCKMAQTCTTMRDLCSSTSLWGNIRNLDFTHCKDPNKENIIAIAQKCPNAELLHLGEAEFPLSEIPDEADEDDQDELIANSVDHLVLEILRSCPKLKHISLDNNQVENKSLEAICAKCVHLQSLSVSNARLIDSESVIDVISTIGTLKSLTINRCRRVIDLNLQHKENNIPLQLTTISLRGLNIHQENVECLAKNCPNLEHLDLSECMRLSSISSDTIKGTDFPKLKTLVLQDCQSLMELELEQACELQRVDLTKCTGLFTLHLKCVSLENVELKECSALHKAVIHSSCLRHMDCSNLPSLEILDFQCPLKSLDLSYCTRLSTEKIESVQCLDKVESLNITGCKLLSPDQVCELLLPKMCCLRELHYGGHSWNGAQLNSTTVERLSFKSSTNVLGLALNMPRLKHLTLDSCRDMTDTYIMDGIRLGKLVKRVEGMVTRVPVEASVDSPQESGLGARKLEELSLLNLPNLQGDVLSHFINTLHCLHTLELHACQYLRNLSMNDCRSLACLRVSSCSRLLNLSVTQSPSLHSLQIKWCSMVQKLEVISDNLLVLDTKGTNFADFTVHSQQLADLDVTGICITSQHRSSIRCAGLKSITLSKCDEMSSEQLHSILVHSPLIQSLQMTACHKVSSIVVPASVSKLRLTAMKRLNRITVSPGGTLRELALNNLPKFTPILRQALLNEQQNSIASLEIRAIAQEKELSLRLPQLQQLTLDQGIHLQSLHVDCPSLSYLRIQGCPKLKSLSLCVEELPHLKVDHSSPLLALKHLHLTCHNVKFLARVLGFYCPNLESLLLSGDNTSLARVMSVGHTVPTLTTLILQDCNPDDDLSAYHNQSFQLQPAQMQRLNNKTLTVMFQ